MDALGNVHTILDHLSNRARAHVALAHSRVPSCSSESTWPDYIPTLVYFKFQVQMNRQSNNIRIANGLRNIIVTPCGLWCT